MRIGIDARPTQGRFTGDSTYWRGLIEGFSRLDSADEFILYTDANLPEPEIKLARPLSIRALRAPNWRIWSVWSFPRALKSDAIDIAHVQYTLPPWMPCPTVTTIHDVSFKRLPQFFKRKDRIILDLGVKRAAKQAVCIVAVSEYTKSEIVDLYGINPEKIEVVYEGTNEGFKPLDRDKARAEVAECYSIKGPYILTVGVIQPRKNLNLLLEAFAALKQSGKHEHKLVIVGKYGWKEEKFDSRIADLNLRDEVILTGYVAHDNIPVLYSAADAMVYPSVYEGFGLPPLEAMACGTPVIAGNRSSIPEVVGDAGILIDPYSVDAFVEAMDKVLSDAALRAQMSSKGLAQAKKFSWDDTARRMIGIYRKSSSL